MKKMLALLISGALAMAFVSAALPLAAAPGRPSTTFKVSPSGDMTGVTDWTKIMAAFDQAKAAGLGNTVQLAAGSFYVNQAITLVNFSGTVCGAGKNRTQLHTAEGTLFQFPDKVIGGQAIGFPRFMDFSLDGTWPQERTDEVTVSDLSFYVDGLCRPYINNYDYTEWNMMWDVVGVTGMADQPSHQNATFRHLKAVGKTGAQGSNLWDVFTAGGNSLASAPTSGTIIFEDVEMYNASGSYGGGCLFVWDVVDSTIRIGGCRDNGILVRNCGDCVLFGDISNSKVEVSHVNGSDVSGGLIVFQGMGANWAYGWGDILPEPSSWYFHDNCISTTQATYAGMTILNVGGWLGAVDGSGTHITKALGPLVIANNELNSKNPGLPGAIFTLSTDNALIIRNKITGNGPGAILLGGHGSSGQNCLLLANNLDYFKAVADEADGYNTPADIILEGPGDDWSGFGGVDVQGTSDCLVVGNKKTTVHDEGTNNLLIGVTKVP